MSKTAELQQAEKLVAMIGQMLLMALAQYDAVKRGAE